MTKEIAREILEDWINKNTQDHLGEHRDIRLPIVDVNVRLEDKIVNDHISFESWSFKGLIKIAYDL